MLVRRVFMSTLFVFVLIPGLALAGGDATKGKQIYSQYCVTCHGVSGRGDGPAGVSLNPRPRNFTDKSIMDSYTDDYLAKVIKGGGASVGKSPMMPPWGGVLKPEDIQNVIAYIRGFSR
jgi:mono/diheme cytochrome c family protein